MEKKKVLDYRMLNRYMLIIMLVVEVVVFSSITPYFLKVNNLLSVGREIATLGIVAIGQTMCILLAGFDLSAGGIAAFTGILIGYCASDSFLGLPYLMSFGIGIAAAAFIGLVNGVLIAKVKISPFITTMSMNFILGGAVILVSKNPITVNNPAFKFLGATTIGSIKFPLPIITLLVLYVVFSFILKYTTFGRNIYATGGNPEAARIAGLNIDRVTVCTYTISAVLSGFAGIVLSSRLATANPNVGSSYAMESIAAAVLGGTALTGGEGNIWGAFFGVLVTGILSNGLVMIGVSQSWRDIATGVVLILAIIIQLWSKKSKYFAKHA